MTDLSASYEEATKYALLDEDIERGRALLGVDVASREREHLTTVTPDAIRNFAYGVGDDNPLYATEDHGRGSRWGGQIAPGIMAAVVNAPLRGDPMPPEVKQLARSLFKGIHVFVSGGTWEWFRALRPGDRLHSFTGEETLDVKRSEFGGRSVIRVRRDVKFNQHGDVVGVYRILRVLTERRTARERGKYADIEPARYTEEDIAVLDARYAAEVRRGPEPRWWEDVQLGESLPPMTKGPLTVTDVIAFHAGGYGFVPYGLPPNRLAFENRRRIPAFYVADDDGIPDVAQRLHWSSSWAKAIGNPMAYDYGVMRECHFHHYLTDWAGDDAFVERQHDEIRRFNYQGDVQHLSGEVVDKRRLDGRSVVDLTLRMTNQRGEHTAFAQATVALPSRSDGLPILPRPPLELQRQVDQMYARHCELGRS